MKSWFGDRTPREPSSREPARGRPDQAHAPLLGPSVAEVVRTRLASASSVRLGVAGGGVEVLRHVVAEDGSLVFVADGNSPVVRQLALGRRASVPVQVRAVDVAPVALPERVRATVVLAGRIGLLRSEIGDEVQAYLAGPQRVWADRPVLVLEPRRVVAILGPGLGAGEPVEIDLAAYRAARTDPLVSVEAEWLQHADAHHGDELAAMLNSPGRVRPLAVDRFGVVLRAEQPVRHVRVWFDAPIMCPCELPQAAEDLVHRSSQGLP